MQKYAKEVVCQSDFKADCALREKNGTELIGISALSAAIQKGHAEKGKHLCNSRKGSAENQKFTYMQINPIAACRSAAYPIQIAEKVLPLPTVLTH